MAKYTGKRRVQLEMRIESIADYLDLIPTVGRWHWEEWGHSDPGGSLETWTENLRRFTKRDRVPTMYVALAGDDLLGSITLNEHDMSTHNEFSPWLSGLYVKPEARGRGVASALCRHLVEQAATMGIERVYLYTNPARGLYEKLGWRTIQEDWYENQPVTIMAFDIGA